MARLFILICTISILFSCDQSSRNKDTLPSSSGKFGEVLILVDTVLQKGLSGEALNNVFLEAEPALPQKEAKFRMATVSPDEFKSILKRSRNVVSLVKQKNIRPNIRLRRDEFAKPQLLVQVEGSSDKEIADLLMENKAYLQSLFNKEEISRLQQRNLIQPNEVVQEELKTILNIEPIIPPGFVSMSKGEHELWLKKEKTIGQHQVLQGLLFYRRAYKSKEDFSIDSMIVKRNEFSNKHVQGSRDSSYMQVYVELNPLLKELEIGTNYAVEYRGLWNMKNDFMGGPFIHYTILGPEGKYLYDIDGFVYAPKFNKREYLRELEAIIKSIRFSSNNN